MSKPSYWISPSGFSWDEPTWDEQRVPLYTIDAAREQIASEMETEAMVLENVDDAVGVEYQRAQVLRMGARWLRRDARAADVRRPE